MRSDKLRLNLFRCVLCSVDFVDKTIAVSHVGWNRTVFNSLWRLLWWHRKRYHM